MLSEISQTERQIQYDFTYMWNLNYKTKQTQRYREQTDGCQMGGGMSG